MKTNLRKTYNYLIRITIIIATYTFLYFEIFHERNLRDLYINFTDLINRPDFIFGLICVFMLMILNWGIETWKWQFLISKIEKVSFFRSYEAVLTGISVSAFLPNRVGEYFGRVFILKKANHIEGILITVIGSLSQLITTILLGSIALLFFIPGYLDNNNYLFGNLYYGIVIFVSLFIILILIFYFNISILTNFLQKIASKKWKKLYKYLRAFSLFNKKELMKVLIISILRYLVFTFQFYLLLKLFSVEIPFYQSFMLIAVFFLILTVIPTVALAEIGIRGSVAIYIFGLFFERYSLYASQIDIGIISASSALWLINIVIPAIAGTIFVFNLKFFRRRNN